MYEILESGVEAFGFRRYCETVLERMEMLKNYFGRDYTEGNDSGNIEIFLIGNGLNMEYINQLKRK